MDLGYPTLSDQTFTKLSGLLFSSAGIKLKDHKKYLLIHRLSKYVGPTKKFKDFDEYYSALKSDSSGELMTDFMNALTTNWTYFFREPTHFEFLREILKKRAKTEKYIRLWSAACSTGEEPYSMSISVLQSLPEFSNYDIKLLASDISTKVLNLAKSGRYHYTKIKGHLDDSELRKYFTFDKKNNDFVVKDNVRKIIKFAYLNLMEDYPFSKQFDVVFLRNVLIYFDNSEKEIIINKIAEHIKPGGYLITGLSESLVGVKHKLTSIKNSIYQK